MKTYFSEEIDKRLLEAETEDEVRASIAEAPEAEKLADKIDLVMKVHWEKEDQMRFDI